MRFADDSEPSIPFRPLRARGRFPGVRLAGLVVIGVMVSAAGLSDETGEAAPVAFDIAPQSLDAALDVFSATSNVQVLYETSLTSGRRSTGVHGFFTPGAALTALLAGTGLTAWHTTSDSY